MFRCRLLGQFNRLKMRLEEGGKITEVAVHGQQKC